MQTVVCAWGASPFLGGSEPAPRNPSVIVGTMSIMNTDIDLQNDPEIPEARQMIIDLVGAHMGPTQEELPQFTNLALDPILSGDDADKIRLLIHAVYQAQGLIVSLLTGMTAWVIAGDEHGVVPDKDQILEDREGFEELRRRIWQNYATD